MFRVGGSDWSDYYLYFDVYPGELDAFDWYIVLKPSSKNKPETKIFVNRDPSQNYDYKFPPEDDTIFIPQKNGLDDPTVINPLHEEPTQNYLGVRIKGSKEEWVDIYVIAVPTGLPLESEQVVLDWIPVKLEVKLWR